MRLPNGYGSVHKLSGNRRNPYRARVTDGWEIVNGNSKQIYKTVGYYPTKKEALNALAQYNENPYDLSAKNPTFEEVYELWSEEHFKTIVPSAQRTWKSAFSYCKPLWKMKMIDIKTLNLEKTIEKADVGDTTKARMKSLFNMMYRYSLKHEIVDKDYAALCKSVQAKAKIKRMPFTDEERKLLWDNLDFPFVDMVLIGIYSGWRPTELATLKISDLNLKDNTFIAGMKTEAGKGRIVPIHSKILQLIMNRYDENNEFLFINDKGDGMTYDKYRRSFEKICKRFNLTHTMHDTRHTFITLAKKNKMDEYILKKIVGHAVSDITEKVYTHRELEELKTEIEKIRE